MHVRDMQSVWLTSVITYMSIPMVKMNEIDRNGIDNRQLLQIEPLMCMHY